MFGLLLAIEAHAADTVLTDEQGGAVAELRLDRTTVRLSESVRVTLSV
jgi:hypothetical protein